MRREQWHQAMGRWTKDRRRHDAGGKYARKKSLDMDFSCFAEYVEKLENLNGNIEKTFGDAMEKAGAQVEADTMVGLEKANLPAKGAYQGDPSDTKAQVIHGAKVEWHGSVAEIGLGFDKTKKGAGGLLITGTPKMLPDLVLEDIYSRPKTSRAYEKRLKDQINADLKAEIERLGGTV